MEYLYFWILQTSIALQYRAHVNSFYFSSFITVSRYSVPVFYVLRILAR